MFKSKLHQLFPPILTHNAVGSRTDYYQQPITALNVPGVSPFFGLHLAIWQLRPLDLQKYYPLESIEGRTGFLAWCVVHGRKEYAALRELKPFWQALAQPAEIPATDYSGVITRLMVLVAMSRSDLQIDQMLTSEVQQINLIQWFTLHGWKELDLRPEDLADCQRPFFEKKLSNGVTFIEVIIYASHPDLQSQFNLETPQGRSGFHQWLEQYGKQETILALLQPTLGASQSDGAVPYKIFGVNLIGYAYGELVLSHFCIVG